MNSPIFSKTEDAFTLVELLVVISIIAIMSLLAVPALNAIKGGGDFNKSVYDIAGVLDQARAYAMANNTYVYVGMVEVDASLAEDKIPQIGASGKAGGRVAIAVASSKDGTRPYDIGVYDGNHGNPPAGSTSWTGQYSGSRFSLIGKLQHFDNLHIASSLPLPAKGKMLRPAVADPVYRLGSAGDPYDSKTPFTYPLNTSISSGSRASSPPSGAQYLFNKVINFDPQGIARIQTGINSDEIAAYIEIDLQPTHGNVVPQSPAADSIGNVAAIQLDCMTGATRVYRP